MKPVLERHLPGGILNRLEVAKGPAPFLPLLGSILLGAKWVLSLALSTTTTKEELKVLPCFKSTLGGVTSNPERRMEKTAAKCCLRASFLGSRGPGQLEDRAFLPGPEPGCPRCYPHYLRSPATSMRTGCRRPRGSYNTSRPRGKHIGRERENPESFPFQMSLQIQNYKTLAEIKC